MARSKPSTRRNPKKSGFPYRRQDDKALDDAAQVERARYYGSIKSSAEEILKEAGDDEDRAQEMAYVYADSAVTYTRDAWKIAWISDSTDAIEEMGGPEDWGARDVTDTITKIAYFAYLQDLREEIDRLSR